MKKKSSMVIITLLASATLISGCAHSAMSTKKDMAKNAAKNAAKNMMMDKSKMPHDKDDRAVVRQVEGKVVYWVLPGPRRLDPALFGTPANPKLVAAVPTGAPPPIKKLIAKLPFLIGVPVMGRNVSADGSRFTTTKKPTPFGDMGVPVKGSLEMTFFDRRESDASGPPPMTPDDVKASIKFTDPAGNHYEVMPMVVVQPPIPGYETRGGVLLNGVHHGATGTGTPLMPQARTYAAFWSFGNIKINGAVADKMKMIHCMTTETVRDKNYKLVFDNELPLPLENTIAGRKHHTHCVVLPVKMGPKGVEYEPVKTAFKLPNGMTQPFIHIMYEQDELVEGPGWSVEVAETTH